MAVTPCQQSPYLPFQARQRFLDERPRAISHIAQYPFWGVPKKREELVNGFIGFAVVKWPPTNPTYALLEIQRPELLP